MKTRDKSVKAMSVGLLLLASGCITLPTMNLKHEASIASTYPIKGCLVVERFLDNRPEDEKRPKQKIGGQLTPQIWSGETSPEMLAFLQKVIECEAKRTRLFTVGQGDFVMSGKVSSLKVDRKCTVFRYICSLFDFPTARATVVYDVSLTKDGKPVFTKRITHIKSTTYWSQKEIALTLSRMSDISSGVLDEAITESIKLLFDDISKQVK
jgi:hypothetical protein